LRKINQKVATDNRKEKSKNISKSNSQRKKSTKNKIIDEKTKHRAERSQKNKNQKTFIQNKK